MKEFEKVIPTHILSKIYTLENIDKLQEIRLRVKQPIIVNIENKEILLNHVINELDIKSILQRMSSYSLYAFEEEFKQGYITIKGGHRVGLSGECVIEKSTVKTIKNIYSLNIRIARQIKGCAKRVIPYITSKDKVFNTIIISPPKCGKTTLIRDIARVLSNGVPEFNLTGKKVSIIDERSEIAASFQGIPQMDIGIRSDIYDNCIKSEGIFMAIRSLAPDVIVCDEIGSQKEIEAMLSAYNSGVNLITTIHGNGIEDLEKRKIFNELLENKILERVVVLGNSKGIGSIENIYDIVNERRKLI